MACVRGVLRVQRTVVPLPVYPHIPQCISEIVLDER